MDLEELYQSHQSKFGMHQYLFIAVCCMLYIHWGTLRSEMKGEAK